MKSRSETHEHSENNKMEKALQHFHGQSLRLSKTDRKVGVFSKASIPSFYRKYSSDLNLFTVFLFPMSHFEG